MTSDFYYKDERCSDGFMGVCKRCQSIAKNKHYHSNKEQYKSVRTEWLNREDNLKKQRLSSKLCHEKGRLHCRIVKEKITKETPCMICKEPRHGCLEFHHINPEEKHMEVGKCHSLRQLFNELPKCVVICSNCHRLFHKGHITLPSNLVPMDIIPYQEFVASSAFRSNYP